MIPIKNIYYMLAYAFSILKVQGFSDLAIEKFDHAIELYASILLRGIYLQFKRGLGFAYKSQTQALSSLRGKIELAKSLKTNLFLKHQMICSFDEFSEDSQVNRILKATLVLLLHLDISKVIQKKVRQFLRLFNNVSTVEISQLIGINHLSHKIKHIKCC